MCIRFEALLGYMGMAFFGGGEDTVDDGWMREGGEMYGGEEKAAPSGVKGSERKILVFVVLLECYPK